MHFGIDGSKASIPSIPHKEGDMIIAPIPDVVLLQARQVVCYVYIESDTSGHTVFEIRLPIIPRPKPANFEVTPEQLDNYNALLAELNQTAERLDQAVAESGYIEFDINDEGHLLYTRTESVDVQFALEDGRLVIYEEN